MRLVTTIKQAGLSIALLLMAAGLSRAEEVVGLIRENCSGYTNCYTSLSAWEAAYGGVNFGTCTVGNLVCADKSAVAQIEGTWTNPDTSAVNFNGWTTGPNNYLRVVSMPQARHDGKWKETAYRLQTNFTSIQINEEHVRLDGLQIYMNNTNFNQWQTGIAVNLGTASGDIRISNSIVRSNGNIGANCGGIWLETTGSGSKYYITNTLIYGFKTNGDYSAGVRSLNGNWTGYFYNVTSNGNDYGFRNSGGTMIAKNCYAGGNTHAAYNGTIGKNNCASSDGTGSPGLTSVAYSVSGGASFNNITLASEDFHIKSNSLLKDAGIVTSTEAVPLNFTVDIDGQTRSAPWDIGADELTSSQSDLTPPSAPGAFAAVAVSSAQINLSWTASSDNVGVAGYWVYRNTAHIATVTALGYSDTGLTAASAYNYMVSAVDAAGNESGRMNASTQTLPSADTAPPSTPGVFTAVPISPVQINLSWTASSDNVGVVKYWILRGGVHIATTVATSYSNSGLAASTAYSYSVAALDAAGNQSGWATASTSTLAAADTVPPAVVISAPTNGATVSGSFTLSGTASDNVSVARVDVSIDSGLFVQASGAASWSHPVETALLANGTHTFTARAMDSSGNVGNHTITLTVNNAAPIAINAKKINVQGKLTDASGNAITGPKIVTFRIYQASTGPESAKLWEDSIGVNLAGGLFNVTLGQNATLDGIAFDKPLYVGFQVAGDAAEMTPRQLLGASAYALGSVGDFNAGRNFVVNGTIRGASWGFGGTYSIDTCATNTTANPITGSASCPAGFSAHPAGKFKAGDTNCTDTLYVCIK